MYVSIYIGMYVCMYVCMYICVCLREKPIKKEKSKNIIYCTISLIVHICFVTISNIIFIKKCLVSHNLVFICFFIFLKFSPVKI